MNVIELNNVNYKYPLAKDRALKKINAKFEEGKLYGIIGPNGGGKTTLCNLVRGLIPNFYLGKLEGEVFINGKELLKIDFNELSVKVGYIFQNPFTQISGVKETVFEEIALGLENLGVPREEMIERTIRIIEQLGIENIIKNNPNALSGGQRQRVAFASVIVMDPPIIVIDEPTSQLDPHGTDLIFDIIHKLKQKGKTILLVEHKIELLAEYADEIIVMCAGEIIVKDSVHKVFSNRSLLDIGVNIPQISLLSQEILDDGIPITNFPITISEAKDVFGRFLKRGQS